MSSSDTRNSHSGFVHDSDSESSIEYVQKKSPMSPNIPVTAPIASSMNVPGLNIDLGNVTSNSSTWSIPNISVTPIPLNPTNTQMHAYEQPGSTPKVSSKANPPFKFPREFLLNQGQNLVHVGHEKTFDGGWEKRPFEHVTRNGLLEGNPGLTLDQNMEPKGKTVQSQEPIEDCDELYASSPLVHKENVTGRHHLYASKPITGHASSSREKLWMMSMRTCL
ncbi:hypothetical protein O181_012277 [Austropuccinia psidii MF-1]|uniref:Uncharacterized protein n=1 Tax=Austropuccinia psidii MF-1 TaxID=1389203 RepID=A0A9Q3BXD9_9BASI|nr:hypothetical protein [Austropuccinia psidii MF-1]